jgi:hypothetical protein
MAPDRISRIQEAILVLRRKNGVKPNELERIARALGRTRAKRGKEPTWVNRSHPSLKPVSIPHHAKLNRFTAGSILDALELDIDEIEKDSK